MVKDERNLRLVDLTEKTRTIEEDIQKVYSGKSFDEMADKIATQLNTKIINTILKDNNKEIRELKESIEKLVNQFQKQIVDEKNSALKISRNFDKKDALKITSIDVHIHFILKCSHIAELFQLKTKKGDKFSAHQARALIKDLLLLDDENFYRLDFNGTKSTQKKYHYDILFEIIERMFNPDKYSIKSDIASKWRTECAIPDKDEIENYLKKLFALLDKDNN